MNNNLIKLKSKKKFEAKDKKKYKVKAMNNSVVYDQEVESQLAYLYYLIL